MITFSGTLLNLDGTPDINGYIFNENTAVELPSRTVPIYFDFLEDEKFLLGKAKLYFRPSKLCYTMELDESKLPEYAVRDLIPHVGGYSRANYGKFIEDFYVDSVALSEIKNPDNRIKKLGEQK